MKPIPKSNAGIIFAIITLLLIVFISIHAAGAFADLQAVGGANEHGFNTFAVLLEFIAIRIATPTNIEWNNYSRNILFVSVFVWFLVVVHIATSKRKTITGKEYGTAQWATINDIKDLFAKNILKAELRKAKGKQHKDELKEQYRNADAILTATERTSIYNYEINNNVLVIGGAGSGKTRGVSIPNILQGHSSYIITDPKGEILEKCGKFLTENGFDIRVLNLQNMEASDCYNPFAYIYPEREGYEERVMSLIETLIANTDGVVQRGGNQGSTDPFWDRAERLFLQAIFFFTCDGFTLENRNMNTVLSLISMLQLTEDDDAHDSDLDYFAMNFKDTKGENHIGYQQYKEFRSKASGKTAKSIVISAVARLAPFRTASLKRIFSTDTMNFNRAGDEKMAIFVVMPPTNKTYNFVAGMLFTQLMQELQYSATVIRKHEGQRLKMPVRLILDEFANTCVIPNFVQYLAYARSFGIGIVVILQSLEQIKHMYKTEWGVIIDNCSARLFLGSVSHVDTLEEISKMLGEGTYAKKTTGRTRGRHGSSSQNWDVFGRKLMDPAELSKLPKKDCILMISGRKPFYSKKYEYTMHPNYKYTSDADKANGFDYVPKTSPQAAS